MEIAIKINEVSGVSRIIIYEQFPSTVDFHYFLEQNLKIRFLFVSF